MAAPGWEDTEEAEGEAALYYYANEGLFVHRFLIPLLEKNWTTGLHWCPEWWEHPEARAVLRAIWHSWEHQRPEPWREAAWFRDVCYPLTDRLLSDAGPFVGCQYGFEGEPRRHDDKRTPTVRQLPLDPLPDGLFEDVPTIDNPDPNPDPDDEEQE